MATRAAKTAEQQQTATRDENLASPRNKHQSIHEAERPGGPKQQPWWQGAAQAPESWCGKEQTHWSFPTSYLGSHRCMDQLRLYTFHIARGGPGTPLCASEREAGHPQDSTGPTGAWECLTGETWQQHKTQHKTQVCFNRSLTRRAQALRRGEAFLRRELDPKRQEEREEEAGKEGQWNSPTHPGTLSIWRETHHLKQTFFCLLRKESISARSDCNSKIFCSCTPLPI